MAYLTRSHEHAHDKTLPFDSAEAAWFWFVQAQTARNEGAQIVAGVGAYSRPCEPVDIYRELERLYRGRRLVVDHIKVLRHYGLRLLSPDPRRSKEVRAYHIWCEAMERLEEALVAKGIVDPKFDWKALSNV
ncbi:MAG: hypothetical protein KDJ26_01240 [Alphaproteobacteria bacterium]|nr:hypothetical protein [Alphaproteobacteria bacterium]MCB1550603.1 hypothetical protein [Alphaproteobacteria bacterium]MCB9985468.1 hypothetical protein [Micavibrio sp.]HPQ50354.1 hypothetical protein [Alphaproteobacteria bacterium]HRK98712.1 hypothetical protein [Alphaproteobacteria bacterium]